MRGKHKAIVASCSHKFFPGLCTGCARNLLSPLKSFQKTETWEVFFLFYYWIWGNVFANKSPRNSTCLIDNLWTNMSYFIFIFKLFKNKKRITNLLYSLESSRTTFNAAFFLRNVHVCHFFNFRVFIGVSWNNPNVFLYKMVVFLAFR